MLAEQVPPAGAPSLVVLPASAVIGLLHGLLVTQLRLQPFLVTLCGLFIYRGSGALGQPDRASAWRSTPAPEYLHLRRGLAHSWLVGASRSAFRNSSCC